MKFDRLAPGGGVEVICRLENAKAYLEWNFYFMQEGEPSIPKQTEKQNQAVIPKRTEKANHTGMSEPTEVASQAVAVEPTKIAEQAKNGKVNGGIYEFRSSFCDGAGTQGSVRGRLLDQKGNIVMECLKALQEDEPMKGVLLQPRLWRGMKESYLYEMEVALTDKNGRCLDRMRKQLPLRDLRNKNTDSRMEILLNGVPFIPKAVRYILPDADGEAQQQRLIIEDLQRMMRLGANCVCMRKNEPARLFLQFCGLCDRYGILVFVQGKDGDEGDWVCSWDRRVRMQCLEEIPCYRSMENGLFLLDSGYPTSLYYKYKAKWNDEPLIYLVPESVTRLESGNYSVRCYSNCSKVALYTDGILFEFQRGEGEFVFREIPARSPCVMLTAEGDGCSTSLSIHKFLLHDFSH